MSPTEFLGFLDHLRVTHGKIAQTVGTDFIAACIRLMQTRINMICNRLLGTPPPDLQASADELQLQSQRLQGLAGNEALPELIRTLSENPKDPRMQDFLFDFARLNT